jgi:TolB-like protein
MILLTALLATLSAAPAAGQRPKLVVMQLTPGGGVDAQVAAALTETVSVEVSQRGFFDVLTNQDINTLLGMERQRQMAGCAEESSSCLTELAGALGARFVMNGSLTQLGDAFQLNLQTLDTKTAQPLGRATRIARDLPALRAQMTFAVAEATATPLPPPPSRMLPFSLIGAGGLAIVAGSVLGLQALGQEGAAARELSNGTQNPAALKTLATYQEEAAALATQKTISVTALVAGAALMGAGIWLNPPEGSAGRAVALMAGPSGFAVVGAFP